LDPPDPSDEEQLVRVGKGERSKRFTHSVDGPSSVTVGEGVVGRVNKEIADCSEQHTWMMSIRRRPRDEVEQIGIVSDRSCDLSIERGVLSGVVLSEPSVGGGEVIHPPILAHHRSATQHSDCPLLPLSRTSGLNSFESTGAVGWMSSQ